MNNNDFDELVKKAQTMINNNQVPPEIAEMMRNMSSNNNDKNSGIDLNAIISNTNFNQESDDISNLLKALKPYMSNAKKEKIDEYIKLVQMGKAAKLFNELNNNNNNK